jgi:hypothetical protein
MLPNLIAVWVELKAELSSKFHSLLSQKFKYLELKDFGLSTLLSLAPWSASKQNAEWW